MHSLIHKIFEAKNRNFWSGRRDLNTSLTSIIPSNTTYFTQNILRVYWTLSN